LAWLRRWVVEVLVSRCAGLDVHKDTVMACVRRPGPGGRRQAEVGEFGTFTDALVRLREWLLTEGVTQVAMEATGVIRGWEGAVRHGRRGMF
jgi:transposase